MEQLARFFYNRIFRMVYARNVSRMDAEDLTQEIFIAMSKKEREVFILRYVDQLGIRELAETLKNSESTVKTHLYRALKKFREAPELRSFLTGN